MSILDSEGWDTGSAALLANGNLSWIAGSAAATFALQTGAYGLGQALEAATGSIPSCWRTIPGGAISYAIMGFHWMPGTLTGATQTLAVFRTSGTAKAALVWNGTTGQLLLTINGVTKATSVLTVAKSVSQGSGTYRYIEWKWDEQLVGTMEVRVDGVVYATFSGDTRVSAGDASFTEWGIFGGVSNLDFNRLDNMILYTGGYLGERRIQTLLPSGAGNSAGLTPLAGANYAAVDEASPDADTTYVSGTGGRDTYAFGNLSGVSAVEAVKVASYSRKLDVGTRTVAPVIRHAGTDYVGSGQTMPGLYYRRDQVYNTNPGTSSVWTPADVDAAEFGVEVA